MGQNGKLFEVHTICFTSHLLLASGSWTAYVLVTVLSRIRVSFQML